MQVSEIEQLHRFIGSPSSPEIPGACKRNLLVSDGFGLRTGRATAAAQAPGAFRRAATRQGCRGHLETASLSVEKCSISRPPSFEKPIHFEMSPYLVFQICPESLFRAQRVLRFALFASSSTTAPQPRVRSTISRRRPHEFRRFALKCLPLQSRVMS